MTTPSLAIEGGLIAVPPRNPEGVRAYKGLPFAAAPVGALRWRPPQPVPAWPGVRSSDAFGMNSLQGIVFDDIDPTIPGVSEDCLYLNVWTPAEPGDGAKLPVMFWIHGGGFVVGSGAEPRYDGARLAARGIVVVTVNHRLGALGFLAHPELTAEQGASGNYGLMDLIAALRWVANHIAAFGGDPTAVTIAGESAGSMAVSALMASPRAKGLFVRAIGESAALFESPSRKLATRAEAERRGVELARDLGAGSLQEMRRAPAQAVLDASPGFGFRPIIDGYVLSRTPAEIFAAGEQSDVPLMSGWNKDEGFNFTLSPDETALYPDLARAIFKDRTDACLALYPAGSPDIDKASARALGGDLTIIHPNWAWIEAQKRTGKAAIFRFRFERCPLTPEGWFGDRPSADAGAFHAGEILYVFDNLGAFPWLYAAEDREITRLASGYWLNFVKTGDPNGHGLPHWPSHREPGAPILAIDAPPKVTVDEERARHEFLASCIRDR
jgi:para-nitrobenzyl esterase